MYIVPVLAAVQTDSETALWNMKKSRAQLVDADKATRDYTTRMIKHQRPFGFRLGIFCYVSLGTGQDIMTNSISYALLFITLVREASG